MAEGSFVAGRLYGSRSQVRAAFREYWKGILLRDGRIGIIHAYQGLARRIHYSDSLNLRSRTLTYVGEGLSGDQALTRGNRALAEAIKTKTPVEVFFDCGDVRLPTRGRLEKHLLAGGRWFVRAVDQIRSDGRRVFEFKLELADEATAQTLSTLFDGFSESFEEVLQRFAEVRTELYAGYRHILNARDSIAGHVGEYFAVKGFNARSPKRPLIRVRSNFPDLDAIQTHSGERFAIKTVTAASQKTSNIWTPLKNLPRVIDSFLVVDLDPWKLSPNAIFKLPVSKAGHFWSRDKHQGSGKLTIDARFRDAADQL